MAVTALAAAMLVGSALSPAGLFEGSLPFSVHGMARPASPRAPLGVRITKVFGSSTPARLYGTQIGRMEDQGVNARGQLISDLSPLSPTAFRAPVAEYKHYAAGWLARVSGDAKALSAALRAGSRGVAKAEWRRAWSAYLHLGAVYGLFDTLDEEIDGMPGGLPGGASSPQFSGLHRIEMGLWDGQPPRSLVHWSGLLAVDVAQLRRVLPSVQITPLAYATRAHEILEDAQRDLLSGMDVPWSGEGVLGTAAGVAATDEVLRTLTPLLTGRDNTLVEVENELLLLSAALATVRHEHHGSWPTLGELSIMQRERIDGTLAGALGALEQLPGTLETTSLPDLPRDPEGR
ncbi:MAG TPA: EfeM/EfeO family lipoprotein [Solirubrobacteraceae bacterium]